MGTHRKNSAEWAREGNERVPRVPRGPRVPGCRGCRECAGCRRCQGGGSARGAAPAATEATGDWYRGGGAAYYQEIFVDPFRPDTIYSVNTNLDRSTDGGKTWRQTNWEETGMHVDHHVVEVRSERQESHPDRQRRRSIRNVRRRRDVSILCQHSGHSVLPRVCRQRETVLQRLRRCTG